MKILLYMVIHTLLILSGLSTTFGFTLPKAMPDRGATYSFGNQYTYDNAGSKWNHERAYQPPGYQNHYNRWYYRYGNKSHHHYGKKRHQFGKYHFSPGSGYRKESHPFSRYQYNSKNNIHRKHIHLRNRIPRHSFGYKRPLSPLKR